MLPTFSFTIVREGALGNCLMVLVEADGVRAWVAVPAYTTEEV